MYIWSPKPKNICLVSYVSCGRCKTLKNDKRLLINDAKSYTPHNQEKSCTPSTPKNKLKISAALCGKAG